MSEVTINGVFYNNYGGTIREYNAIDFTKPLGAITRNGVCGPDELEVSFISGVFTVTPGRCFINGFFREFTETHSFSIIPNHNGYIVAELDASPDVRSITIKMLSQEGALPELIQNSITYQMPLVEFNSADSVLTKIEDVRTFSTTAPEKILNIHYNNPNFNDFMKGFLWKHTPVFDPAYGELTPSGTFNTSTCILTVSTGEVIFSARNSTESFIGIYNPYTRVYSKGPTISTGFTQAAITPSGKTILFPTMGNSAYVYDPITKSYEYGPMVDRNIVAAITAPTGEIILASETIGIYNHLTNSITNGPAVGANIGSAVLTPTNEVLLIPNVSRPLIRYNPKNKTITEGPVIGDGYDYAVVIPSGKIALIPDNYTYTPPILFYDPFTNILTEGPEIPYSLASQVYSPVLTPKGSILMIGYISSGGGETRIIEYDIESDEFENIGKAITTNYTLRFMTLAPTGELIFPPSNAQNKIGILNLMGGDVPVPFCIHPYINN